jgi:hypothetical protein
VKQRDTVSGWWLGDVIGPVAREDQIADIVRQQFDAAAENPALAGAQNLHKAALADHQDTFIVAN